MKISDEVLNLWGDLFIKYKHSLTKEVTFKKFLDNDNVELRIHIFKREVLKAFPRKAKGFYYEKGWDQERRC